jgi:ketosteroid isomerase-like protein
MRKQTVLLACVVACLSGNALVVASVGVAQTQPPGDEQTLWKLEHDYWRDAQSKDLTTYLSLWNNDLLAWPSSLAAPVHKDHITDWITSQTGKGLTLKFSDFKPAAIQVIGNRAVVCYWLTYGWVDKDGNGATHIVRILHNWMKDSQEWHLVSGMSMPEPPPPQK